MQRDYIRRNQSMFMQNKKSSLQRKYYRLPTISPLIVVAIAIFTLIAFIDDLYFTNCKKDVLKEFQNNKVINNDSNLPPKPEERWLYIKELENRYLDVEIPTEFSSHSKKKNNNQFDSEHNQHQIKDVKYLKTQITSPLVYEDKVLEQSAKKNQQQLIIQCGSFKNIDQAEIVRAKLAFEGFYSRIINNNNWNRVVIDSNKDEKNVDSIINHLKSAGYSNCICLSGG